MLIACECTVVGNHLRRASNITQKPIRVRCQPLQQIKFPEGYVNQFVYWSRLTPLILIGKLGQSLCAHFNWPSTAEKISGGIATHSPRTYSGGGNYWRKFLFSWLTTQCWHVCFFLCQLDPLAVIKECKGMGVLVVIMKEEDGDKMQLMLAVDIKSSQVYQGWLANCWPEL